jgi:pimeloyl-ACP methyl ester carboxylesterase
MIILDTISAPTFRAFRTAEGNEFCYLSEGAGASIVFQHGLGGSIQQAWDLFGGLNGARLYAMDCRLHGRTKTVDEQDFSVRTLVGDQIQFAQQIIEKPHFMGGISLGCLLTIKACIELPDLIKGLVLIRPSWPDPGCDVDFARARSEAAQVLRPIFNGPFDDLVSHLGDISMPALIIGMPDDPQHPIGFAEEVASRLPNSVFKVVPSKSRDPEAYRNSVRRLVNDFVTNR